MNERILVVGGAGYIGSHMLLALRDSGYSVFALDNLSRGNKCALMGLPLIRADLRNFEDVFSALQSQRFDVVMHFAAFAYVGESVSDPEVYYHNNVLGTLNLLAAMRKLGVNRFVFSSSCAVYGEPKWLPIDESHPQIPINPYGRSKLIVEQALRDYASAYNLSSISLRYFNAAGCDPDGRVGERHFPETHLIPLVLAEALRLRDGGDPAVTTLKVFGTDFDTRDGSCIRDYIHVSDLCTAHLQAMRRLLLESNIGAEAYNLANDHGFTVFEVIEACRQLTGQPIQYHLEPRRNGDPSSLVGNSDLARKKLGWYPRYTDLNQIIQTAWQWIQNSNR